MSNPVEDVAADIVESVRKHKWPVDRIGRTLTIGDSTVWISLTCKDASEAKRLAEMMRAPPRSAFDAMGIDPVDPLERFPSVRGKA